MMVLHTFRRLVQSVGYDLHRISKDDSPFIDPATASLSMVSLNGKAVRFLVTDPTDTIQKHHAEGRFYEQDLLDLVARYLRAGECFVDIGANVGNHAVFAASHLGAGRVIALEPMRYQHAILTVNTLLNDLQQIVQIRKTALSSRMGFARMITPNPQNTGRSMISDALYGEWVRLVPGDDLLADESVDFIKIDVEGHEFEVLAGLSITISRNRPTILIEINDSNADAFATWLGRNAYVIRERFRHHGENTEALIVPE